MPHVINGIGTWYYGKKRIHRIMDTCEFCNRNGPLSSYDTTLYFVVAMVPLIPLSRKRILRQCAACSKHRELDLKKWEAAKKADGDRVLEHLQRDPENRDAILGALGYATGYQDEPLFDRLAGALAADRRNDAAIQFQLGAGYGYFSRWPEAEEAYRASLAAEDNEATREHLAVALLKQNRADEARPYLQHILEQKKRNGAGLIYLLIGGLQAQGLHDEALQVIDARDQAFPDWVNDKDYRRQRQASVRYQGTNRKIRSAFIEARQEGYREGGRHLAPWIALLVILGLIALYCGVAIYKGEARRVFLVNGTDKPYTVNIQNQAYDLQPHAWAPIHVAEGDIEVAFADAKLNLPPARVRIETSFWGRPFDSKTFIINPDQSAVIVEEEAYYAKNNPPAGQPPQLLFGSFFYERPDIDYPFDAFPPSIKVKGDIQVRKTRIGLSSPPSAELRFMELAKLDKTIGPQVGEKVLRIDPDDVLCLRWYIGQVSPDTAIKFLETRLEERPTRVEWHRAYQTMMDRSHPETDLLPRYRQLVAETNRSGDALYLLGRADSDLDQAEKLYLEGTQATPPSSYAFYALGFRALCDGRFAAARDWFQKAAQGPAMSNVLARHYYEDALLANGDFDMLLNAINQHNSGDPVSAGLQTLRIYAIRHDKVKTKQKMDDLLKTLGSNDRESKRRSLAATIAIWEGDADAYISAAEKPTLTTAVLKGDLKAAEGLIDSSGISPLDAHALLYLAAKTGNAKKLAVEHEKALIDALKQGDRDQRWFAEFLTNGKLPNGGSAARLPLEPDSKRLLLYVACQKYPDLAAELMPLAKRLDFQHDAVSLCLAKLPLTGQKAAPKRVLKK